MAHPSPLTSRDAQVYGPVTSAAAWQPGARRGAYMAAAVVIVAAAAIGLIVRWFVVGLFAAAARDPGSWIRRGKPYYMISLILFLALIMVGSFGFIQTQGSGLHHPIEWGIDLGVGGALLSLVLFVAAGAQFRVRQLVWAL